MSEEAFSWFKRSKKREIDPEQDPSDRLMSSSDSRESIMKRMREQEIYSLRTLFPGSYRADDYTLMISGQLPPHIHDLVLFHEYAHVNFGQKHYGEVIRRLETFGILVTRPLNEIRGFIILNMFHEEQDPNYKPSPEKFREFNDKLDREEYEKFIFERVPTDKLTRQRIRERLASDQVFMRGLHFLDKVDKRKNLLLAHWKKAQEGGAYWMSLYGYEQWLAQKEDTYRREATELVKIVRAKLLQSEDENGEGFRMVQKIAGAWGAEFVYPALEVIMSPDITQLSILHASLADISQKLSTTRFSPDHRLEAIYQMAVSHSFLPKEVVDIPKLYQLLDPDNPQPDLSVDRCNAYWNTLDSDPEFVSLMTDLKRWPTITLGWPGNPPEYQPFQMPEGGGKLADGEMIGVTSMDHEGQVQQEGWIPSRREDSINQDMLLRTMRREGLI